jgi:hypothetical protein
MVVPSNASRVTFDVTTTDDNPFRLADHDLYYYELTVWCLSNNAYMGNANRIVAPLNSGDVYYDRNGNLGDLFFRNKSAGSNTNIVAVATVPNEVAKEVLGL